MSPQRRNMLDKCYAIVNGKIQGNLRAAQIAIATWMCVENSDFVLGKTTDDSQLNEIITREILSG